MLVSHTHKFIFIHMSKTAGTSIEETLLPLTNAIKGFDVRTENLENRKNLSSRYLQKHCHLKDLRPFLGNEICDSYFKFTFVRNPWDLHVALYLYCNEMYQIRKKEGIPDSDISEATLSAAKESFSNFVKTRFMYQNGIFSEDGSLNVDFVGKFENLYTDFEMVCKRIGLTETPNLLHLHGTEKVDYRPYYNNETRDLVAHAESHLIKEFGYRF